ncbi:MAG: glycosyltransferase [Candidatus Margulisbacteria bacterium]|jgi:glycosyltransferase involved in cell wall biosynthesis|nr:glycosyltransferase [Candidatus Margulisiibacteriota bacterium]
MKISVLLPAYNAAPYLPLTLDALAGQTFRDFEIVFVDDCSTDGTLAIMQNNAARFPAAQIMHNKTNQKLARALNIGLRRCQGEYIFRLDADDLLTPDALEKMLKTLAQNPQANGVVCDRLHIDAAGRPQRMSLTLTENYYLQKNILFRTAFGGQPCLIRKDIWSAAGLFNADLRFWEDYAMGLKMARHIHIVGVPERLYLYREYAGNMTSRSRQDKTAQARAYIQNLKNTLFTPADYSNAWEQVKRHKDLLFDFAAERNQKYANIILRCALHLAALGRRSDALAELKKAEYLAPQINYSAFAFLLKLGFKNLDKFRVNMNCWFNYAYDDHHVIPLQKQAAAVPVAA